MFSKCKVAVEPELSVRGADRHCRDGRDLVALVAMDQPRRLAPWRPGPAPGGHQQKTALFQERQVRPQAPGFLKLHPRVPLPVGDGGLVAPQGALLRLLVCPARVGQAATDVRAVVGDAEFLLKDGGDPSGGPQIVRKPIRPRGGAAAPADVAAGSASAGAPALVSPPGLRGPGDAASHATATWR